MDSTTSAIIIAILVALLVSTIVYLTHLVRVIRQSRRQQSSTPSGLESTDISGQINVPDITIKDASEMDGLGVQKEAAKQKKDTDSSEGNNKEHLLSNLTDTSIVSDSPSTVSRENLVRVNEITDSANVSKLEALASASKLPQKIPPPCPYKGKIPCTCQQARGSMDLLRHHNNPSHTYPRTMQSTSSFSSGRHSTSAIDRVQYSDGKDKVHQWIAYSPSISQRNGKLPNHHEEDDDDQPIINHLNTGSKEDSIPLSNPRSRTRPSSPLSPHRTTTSSIVYPNQTFSDHHRLAAHQNINTFAYSPSWPNMPFYYAPAHLMAPNSPSHKSRVGHLARKSEDYYQQRVV
ncbi:hypothetical protein INT43_007328 [Umbelopsis isabellina]|uniref:Uncharacterized protein n=1 Tax=Mortierella isabellina TaxID=91625 RepID=A0A8H7PZ15_MORIS|nr:hypothetical protein INT43_007328 [Umbelopsis isabellina]